jgi:hypothetical protein
MFTLCQSLYGVYACTPDGATISDSDETDPNTRVYAIMCTWAPTVVSYLIR